MAVAFPMVTIMVPVASLAVSDEMFYALFQSDLSLVRYELLYNFGGDFFEVFDTRLAVSSFHIHIAKATFDVQLMVLEAILPANRRHVFMCRKGISSLLDRKQEEIQLLHWSSSRSLFDYAAGPDDHIDVYGFHLISAVLFNRLPDSHGRVLHT